MIVDKMDLLDSLSIALKRTNITKHYTKTQKLPQSNKYLCVILRGFRKLN
jgi:hypothetical protein